MPNLPTDNLYKFMAIFGLVLVGYSLYIQLQKIDEYGREVVQWNTAWGPLIARAQHLDDDAREALQCTIDEAKERKPIRDCAAIEASKGQRQAASREQDRMREELSGRKEFLDYLRKQADYYRVLGTVIGLFGALISTLGFWLWYVRLQRPADRAIRSSGA